MLRRFAAAGALAALMWHGAPAPAVAQATPTPTPTPDARGERIFARAREVWRKRSDVPYLRYGALVRYMHKGHVFDNWWDAWYRSEDGALALDQIYDIAEERRRLGGVPFSIFGVTIFDTNPDAEPIRLDPPGISPISSFGVLTRGETPRAAGNAATPTPMSSPEAAASPSPQPGVTLRTIANVAANVRQYQIVYVGVDVVRGRPALHLKLIPLQDPEVNRLRDLWVDPATYRTVALRVQGLLSGKPYDDVLWTVQYVQLDGRNYVQQIVAEAPLHFGFDVTIPKFEFDFVDYHFPAHVPPMTFDGSESARNRSE